MNFEEHAAQIHAFLALTDDGWEKKHVDVAFIHGGSTLKPIERGVALYKAGITPMLCFISTGGTFGGEKIWGMPEYEKYVEVCYANGIPDSALCYAGLTSNTLQEAQHLMSFVGSRGFYPKVLALVSRAVHQRRALATFRRWNPGVEVVSIPADETADISPEGIQRMLDELERIRVYGEKGDLIQQEIPKPVEASELYLKLYFNV